MNAKQVLSKCLSLVTPLMHKTRRQSLFSAIESSMNGGSLSITGLGRDIDSNTLEKHKIKRVDRLCSNTKLHRDIKLIYTRMAYLLVGKMPQPIIHIDWSDLDDKKESFLIRASLAAQGRSLTLYEEILPLNLKEKPKIHLQFMTRLKAMLPSNCKPIIVTDAGFRIPWFKQVLSLEWDYVGRVRNRTQCFKSGEYDWQPIKNLYMKATSRAQSLGEFLLGQTVGFKTRLVIYKRHPKGRKDMNAKGDDIRKDKRSRASAAREKEPWLLATSLCSSSTTAKKIVKCYATRMQIEESFRDVKTGLKMNDSRTRIVRKLNVLLIIASLSQFMLYLLGLAVKAADKHRQYQANSIKHRNVLSNQFIGLRAYKDKKLKLLKLLKHHWRAAISSLKEIVRDPQACY
ncbi:IS4 family transposase [Shewanella eurypsychrophilus]|uniref:IS4 family transposase n=1 Tax=Shewanella eurypsychrophilus TaxID=2593656 RepID=A0ABX6VCD1_9GAMM|nr:MULTISPECIES: IS4 family transposase [Shewanella]QFU25193.1 IS4 family transposase [Shewanella sp. YLB-09]QPG60343.1 IS4 family transposase [Shewanella eurypsychrophilus]